ncbi:SDR family NAD(P)-dependent oxidoreductase [Actinomadura sp. LD22]|uniref:SDR family NAD(P)-dependent oxidoreductase n=1 Tax=Actinomadura physcomitrii TaxID=2650748 RepID=A0A6I4MCW9_9ACTN|nr:SDR family NAD(P)-dependent oxidoreductase [Actinomadura physcomitrii]
MGAADQRLPGGELLAEAVQARGDRVGGVAAERQPATSGFGRAIAEAALAAGDTVVAAARRPQALDDLAERHPGRVNAVALDVTDHGRIADVVADVLLSARPSGWPQQRSGTGAPRPECCASGSRRAAPGS